MRSIEEVVRDVIDYTDINVGSQRDADRLVHELCDGLTRAGYDVGSLEGEDALDASIPLNGVANIAVEATGPDGVRGRATLKADVRVRFTTVAYPDSPWLSHYLIQLSGRTVPMDERGTQLRFTQVEISEP